MSVAPHAGDGSGVGSGASGSNDLYLPIASGGNMSVRLSLDSLPADGKFVFGAGRELAVSELLASELAPPEIWLGVALSYLRAGDSSSFESLLGDFTSEDAQNAYANEDHFRAGRIAVFNALAAYETRRAMLGASAAEREQASQRAAALCNTAADVDTHATMTWVCKGALMLIKEQLSDAQAALHSAILTDTGKEHALTRLAMGCVLVLKKQYADALKHFKAAIQMNPALPAYCRLGFAICYYQLGDYAQSRASFERVLSLSRSTGEGDNVHALLGLATLDMNEWREQVATIENETRKHPTGGSAAQSAAMQAKMQALNSSTLVDDALQHLSDAYKIDPHNVLALLLLSSHSFYRNDLRGARDYASRALERCDQCPQLCTVETRATALYHLARTYHVEGDQHAERGDALSADTAYEQAYASYDSAKALQPLHALPTVCLGLAQMLHKRGETERAIDSLEHIVSAAAIAKAGSADPAAKAIASAAANNFDVQRLLGSLYAEQPSKAAVLARASAPSSSLHAKDKPKDPLLAIVLPDYERAYAHLQRSVDLHPNSLELLCEFAAVAMARHVYTQAYLSYKRVIKLLTDVYKVAQTALPPALLHNLAVAAHQLHAHALPAERTKDGEKYLQEAKQYYQMALDNRAVQGGEGNSLSAAMELDGPAAAATAAVADRMTADSVTTHYNMALLSASAGASDAALAKLSAIVTAWPNYADALLVSASLHQRHADYPRAWTLLQQAAGIVADRNPELQGVLQCQMGNWHLEQGDADAASKCFDAVLTKHKSTVGKRDDYAKVELGTSMLQRAHRKMRQLLLANPQLNVALNASAATGAVLQLPPALEAKLKEHRDKFKDAGAFYVSVLAKDPRNVYAAQGLACVLAEQGKFGEAKEILSQVKDLSVASTTAAAAGGKDAPRDQLELADVWVNLGHIQVAQGSFVSAIKMYQHVLDRMQPTQASGRALGSVQVLTYLARAYYLSDHMHDAKRTLLKALHLAPQSSPLWYNLALVSEAYAIEVFQKAPAARSFREVESAILELNHAFAIFQRLAAPLPTKGDEAVQGAAAALRADTALFGDIADKAGKHAVFCRYSIEHGQPHLVFARQREEEQARLLEASRGARAKLEEEIAARAAEARAAAEAERLRLEEEARAKKKYLEDISATWETVVSEESSSKKARAASAGGGGGGGDDDEGMGGVGDVAEEMARRKEKGRNKKKSKRERDSGSEGEGGDEEESERRKKKKKDKKARGRSKYQEAEQSDDGGAGGHSDKEPSTGAEGVDVDAELAARRAKAGHLAALTTGADGEVKQERKSRLTKASADTDDDEAPSSSMMDDDAAAGEPEAEAEGEADADATGDAAVEEQAAAGGDEDDEEEVPQKKSSNKKRRQIDDEDGEEEEEEQAEAAVQEEAAEEAAPAAAAAEATEDAAAAAAEQPPADADAAMTDA